MNAEFMWEAIRLSQQNIRDSKGGPFASVIVKEGKIVARGTNLVTTINDPTAHAEIVAIREACKTLGSFHLEGCEIYTSCEPCPMCLAAIYWARIEKIYYANSREDAAKIGFDDLFLYHEIPKQLHERKIPMKQLMREEALAAFREWEQKQDKIPY